MLEDSGDLVGHLCLLNAGDRAAEVVSLPEISVPAYECIRCAHKWVPRSIKFPKACPKCNSPYWNTPRVREPRRRKPGAKPNDRERG